MRGSNGCDGCRDRAPGAGAVGVVAAPVEGLGADCGGGGPVGAGAGAEALGLGSAGEGAVWGAGPADTGASCGEEPPVEVAGCEGPGADVPGCVGAGAGVTGSEGLGAEVVGAGAGAD